ncbi:hypothetical protein GCM10025868_31350 [Angustibacter aerolatus]|uniref:NADH:quinone oxidoreductase/Mrp antiporter membrane subunit domain-containing protein n=1 Tax=Angustibacter aerolatus TaxID=1162965 RepID=A0ABQ6JI25_9ACTN|nr:hypothetical protein GCM10025868_31350 [Angustibacter aerolatus]
MSPGDGAQALVWTARLLVLLPALAALLGAFVARPARRTQSASGVAGAGVAVLLAVVEVVLTRGREVVAVPLLGPVETGAVTVHLDLRADRLSAVVALMVAVVALCVQVYSVRYQETDPRHRSYVATVRLFTTAMLLVVHADDLLLLLIGWEAMGLCSYLLVGHESERTAARAAAVKAFLVTRVGDVGFLLGVVVLLAAAGTTSISTLLDPAVLGGLGGGTITAAVLLLTLGVLGKSAQPPLHTWLPDAMEGPTPVSALIHAATMVAAGGYVLARLLPLAEQAPAARAVLAVVTALTMLVAALVALAQTDLKRVLAWSTISQVAYLLAALAVTPPELGAAPGVVRCCRTPGSRRCCSSPPVRSRTRCTRPRSTSLAGAWRRAPLVAVALTVGLASLAGVPPLSGYWSKEGVLGAAEEATHGPFGWAAWLVLVSGLLTGLVTAAYATRTWLLVVRDVPAAEPPVVDGVQVPDETVGDEDVWPPPVAAVPGAMLVPLAVLAVPALLGGLLLLDPVVPGQVHVGLPTALVAAGLAVLGVVAALAAARRHRDPALALPPRVRAALLDGLGLDALPGRLVVRPVQALARVVRAGDDDVVDGYVRAAGWAARWGGRGLVRTQTGRPTTQPAVGGGRRPRRRRGGGGGAVSALLVLLVGLPLLVAALLLLVPRWQIEPVAVPVGVVTASVTLLASVLLLAARPWQSPDPVAEVDVAWVPTIGVRLHLLVDGIALPLVLLTAVLGLAVMLLLCRQVPGGGSPQSLVAALLAVEGGALAAFTAADLVVFFVAFEPGAGADVGGDPGLGSPARARRGRQPLRALHRARLGADARRAARRRDRGGHHGRRPADRRARDGPRPHHAGRRRRAARARPGGEGAGAAAAHLVAAGAHRRAHRRVGAAGRGAAQGSAPTAWCGSSCRWCRRASRRSRRCSVRWAPRACCGAGWSACASAT